MQLIMHNLIIRITGYNNKTARNFKHASKLIM